MQIQINSMQCIQQLKKGDIIFHSVEKENYLITDVGDNFVMLSDLDNHRALRIIYFADLIKGRWQFKPTTLREDKLG